MLIFNDISSQFEIFNLAPSDILTMDKLAKLLRKKTVWAPAFLLHPILWLAWHLTRGRVPTPPGTADFLIYPINIDGSKITRFGFQYNFSSEETFLGKNGD